MSLDGVVLTEFNDRVIKVCRARSGYTYVQADLAPHSPQNESMFAYDLIQLNKINVLQNFRLVQIESICRRQHKYD